MFKFSTKQYAVEIEQSLSFKKIILMKFVSWPIRKNFFCYNNIITKPVSISIKLNEVDIRKTAKFHVFIPFKLVFTYTKLGYLCKDNLRIKEIECI